LGRAGTDRRADGPFALEFGLDLHQVQTKPATRFYTVQLGVLFR